MNTSWLLVFSAIFPNGNTLGGIAGSYDELAQCVSRAPYVKAKIIEHLKETTGETPTVEVMCTVHHSEE